MRARRLVVPGKPTLATTALARVTLLAVGVSLFAPATALADDTSDLDRVARPTIVVANDPQAQAEKVLANSVPSSLNGVRAKSAGEIAKRLASLSNLTASVAAANDGCGANASILAQIESARAYLTALGQTIAADTDLAKAKADYRLIFTDVRVYLLVAPKTHVVLNCDTHVVYGDTLRTAAAKLTVAIANAKATGRDTSVAQVNLDSALKLIDAALASNAVQVTSVLGLLADKGSASVLASNSAALDVAKANEKAADAQMDAARKMLRAGFESLKVKAPASTVKRQENTRVKLARANGPQGPKEKQGR